MWVWVRVNACARTYACPRCKPPHLALPYLVVDLEVARTQLVLGVALFLDLRRRQRCREVGHSDGFSGIADGTLSGV